MQKGDLTHKFRITMLALAFVVMAILCFKHLIEESTVPKVIWFTAIACGGTLFGLWQQSKRRISKNK